MSTITYLAWQLDKRVPVAREIATAIRRFEQRCGCCPTELLVAPDAGISWPGLLVHEAKNIPSGQVWLGADLEQVLASLAERAA